MMQRQCNWPASIQQVVDAIFFPARLWHFPLRYFSYVSEIGQDHCGLCKPLMEPVCFNRGCYQRTAESRRERHLLRCSLTHRIPTRASHGPREWAHWRRVRAHPATPPRPERLSPKREKAHSDFIPRRFIVTKAWAERGWNHSITSRWPFINRDLFLSPHSVKSTQTWRYL